MDEGYILSNKYRKIIFEGFALGEKNINNIAKKHRIILSVAKRITEEFNKMGIIEKNKNGYVLTQEGEKLASKLID